MKIDGNLEKDIRLFFNIISPELPIKAVYVFGSYSDFSKSIPKKGSDLDLLVLTFPYFKDKYIGGSQVSNPTELSFFLTGEISSILPHHMLAQILTTNRLPLKVHSMGSYFTLKPEETELIYSRSFLEFITGIGNYRWSLNN